MNNTTNMITNNADDLGSIGSNEDNNTNDATSNNAANAIENNNEYKAEPSTTPNGSNDDLRLLTPQGQDFEQQQQQSRGGDFGPEFEFDQQQQQQQQQQQYYGSYQNGYAQQQWPQYQQQQQQQMYPPTSHHEMSHQMQQPGNYHQSYAGYNMYPSATGPVYNGGAVSPNGANGSHTTATPSPTTNSDDSGGDCVNESKRLLQLGGGIHQDGYHQHHQQQHQHHQHIQQQQGPNLHQIQQQHSHHMVPVGATPLSPHHPHPHPHGGGPHPPQGHFYPGRGVPMVQKRPRQTRRSKKKRDPNEPQKPVSAYALFFRDMQAGIKARNPNASFGEVSKHVASMWDNLNPDHKNAYKKRTENAKKEYLKQLAAYRANLVSKNHGGPDPYSPYGGLASYYKSSSSFDGSATSFGGGSTTVRAAMSSPAAIAAAGDAGANRESGTHHANGTIHNTYHHPHHAQVRTL